MPNLFELLKLLSEYARPTLESSLDEIDRGVKTSNHENWMRQKQLALKGGHRDASEQKWFRDNLSANFMPEYDRYTEVTRTPSGGFVFTGPPNWSAAESMLGASRSRSAALGRGPSREDLDQYDSLRYLGHPRW